MLAKVMRTFHASWTYLILSSRCWLGISLMTLVSL